METCTARKVNDFRKVYKVIESCKNLDQLEIAYNFFQRYLNFYNCHKDIYDKFKILDIYFKKYKNLSRFDNEE